MKILQSFLAAGLLFGLVSCGSGDPVEQMAAETASKICSCINLGEDKLSDDAKKVLNQALEAKTMEDMQKVMTENAAVAPEIGKIMTGLNSPENEKCMKEVTEAGEKLTEGKTDEEKDKMEEQMKKSLVAQLKKQDCTAAKLMLKGLEQVENMGK